MMLDHLILYCSLLRPFHFFQLVKKLCNLVWVDLSSLIFASLVSVLQLIQTIVIVKIDIVCFVLKVSFFKNVFTLIGG